MEILPGVGKENLPLAYSGGGEIIGNKVRTVMEVARSDLAAGLQEKIESNPLLENVRLAKETG